MSEQTDVIVLGGGPAGYAAAFKAADLGLTVTLVEKAENPGGVCLYRGCIPSKALLHVAKLIHEAREAEACGVSFGEPSIDLDKLRQFKDQVVNKLTGGLGQLPKARAITYVRGTGVMRSSNDVLVTLADGTESEHRAAHVILATGSAPVRIPNVSIDDGRVMDSTGALALADIPKSLLVVGGGYIGLEMGSVYAALGSKVTVVEMTDGLLPGADRDLVAVLEKRIRTQFHEILLSTKVNSVKALKTKLKVSLEDARSSSTQSFDRVLVAVGRRPNTAGIGLENTKVTLNKRGFAEVNGQQRTQDAAVFAIGDIAGEPMLAHKGSHEGIVAAEVIAGHTTAFEANAIPGVVFTDPELAWCGVTEDEANRRGLNTVISRFPWAASGRATTLDRNDGLTKLIVDAKSERVLGVGICGVGAGEMIAEGVLAVEMAATVSDLKLSIHAHPTLSETVMEAAELVHGPSTHVFRPAR